MYRTSSAHEEGGERVFSVNTTEFVGDESGRVRALRLVEVEQQLVDGRPRSFQWTAPSATSRPISSCWRWASRDLSDPGSSRRSTWSSTSGATWLVTTGGRRNQPGVFVCGDAGGGQSLIVWAIAEGRSCAASVDHHLMGETALPAPVHPDRALQLSRSADIHAHPRSCG